VLVKASFAVGAVALEGGVGLVLADDLAEGFAVRGRVSAAVHDVIGRALLALLIEEADALEEALAWLGWGGTQSLANVDVVGLDAACPAVIVLFLLEGARADADLETLAYEV
jgi:hypothetical protein